MIGRAAKPALLILALAATGCAGIIVPDIHDLELAGLEAVTAPGPAERADKLESENFYPALIISVATATDLVWFSDRHGVTVFSEVTPCDTPGEYWALASFGAYDRYGRLSSYNRWRDGTPVEPPDARGRHAYRSLLKLRDGADNSRTWDPPTRTGRPAYDLREAPVDLCFHLRGGNMLMAHYVSNTVRIPAAMIRAALDRAGL
jgi:hypothetical protein